MRRALPILSALATVVGLLTACGTAGSIAPSPAGEFTPAAAGTLTVATLAVPTPGFWEGTAAAPDGGVEDGLARAMATRFGLSSVTVVTVPLGRIVAGDLGGADIVLGQLTPTDPRREVLDFSVPYLAATPTVLVRTGTAVPDVYTAKRLRWAATADSTLVTALEEQIDPDTPVTATTGQDASVAMLQAGQVDAVMLDLPVAMVLVARSGGTLSAAAQLPGDDSIAAAVPRGSPNAAAVDTAIRRFTADGTLADLADRWLGSGYAAGTDAVPLLRTGS